MSLEENGLAKDHILPPDLVRELLRLSEKLERATADYQEAAYEYAVADTEYRKAKAVSYIAATADDKRKPRKEQRTIPALEATRDIECENERFAERIGKAKKEACREIVESCRAQLSALQTVARSLMVEMELSKLPQRRD